VRRSVRLGLGFDLGLDMRLSMRGLLSDLRHMQWRKFVLHVSAQPRAGAGLCVATAVLPLVAGAR
jgi:hypothetical protein